jgi:hypothetical protein
MSDQGRFKQLEDRLDQLTIRSLISEVIFAFATAMTIREFEEGSRRKLMNELRKSIWATVEGLPGARAEWLKLHADGAGRNACSTRSSTWRHIRSIRRSSHSPVENCKAPLGSRGVAVLSSALAGGENAD